MINENTKIEGILFTVPKEKRRTNGPVMEGKFQIEGEAGKFDGAAWTKDTKGTPDKPSFSTSASSSNSRASGSSTVPSSNVTTEKKADKYPDYYGTLNLGRNPGDPELRIAGWKRKAKSDNTPFISIVIEPSRTQGAEEHSGNDHEAYSSSDADLPI